MTKKQIVTVACLGLLASGCTSTFGGFADQTHFSFPNSNVTSLGNIKVSIPKRCAFLIPPSFRSDETLQLIRDALAQKPGSDLIINYSIDTTYTTYPYYYCVDMTITGEAAKMEVGKQELQELIDKAQY
uniref:Lipoprotein n=1 Tax=Candidatus Kentrum sp. TUN TaxID=2126343 RepID=A0A450ZQM6_9GAMM|nr:MAG: hypothetical protein BECKTUN1418D_GA0071000_10418 [Candidatus Kentron sp. TUN]